MKCKIIIVTIIMLLGNQKTFSQSSSIKGKCIEYKTSDVMAGVSMDFYTHSGKEYATSTNNYGDFELKKGDDSGDLLIRFLGCYVTKVLNIPQGLKHIDLGEIKILQNNERFLFNMDGSASVLSEEQIAKDKKWRNDVLKKYCIKVLGKELKPYFEGNYLVFDFKNKRGNSTLQWANYQWVEFEKRQIEQNEIIIFQKLDKTDFRKNPDGVPFIKTSYKFEIKTGSEKIKIQLKDHFYIDKEACCMAPSIYIDDEQNLVYIFVLEKNEESRNYGMDGYVYEYNMKLKKIEKGVVFKRANFGWFPYFTKGDDGQLLLRHFSYAGRIDMISLKNKDGNWVNGRLQNITPEEAEVRYMEQL